MAASQGERHGQNLVSSKEVGLALRKARKAAGLTQVGLADKAGVSRNCIMRLEGNGSIHATHLFAVLEALELSIDVRPMDYDNTSTGRRERFFADLGFPAARQGAS